MPAVEPPEATDPDAPRGARRMVRTFVSLLGAEMSPRALLVVAALVAVRLLVPDSSGEYAYAFAPASVINFVLGFGLTTPVTRDVSASPGQAPHLLGAFVKAQGGLAVL